MPLTVMWSSVSLLLVHLVDRHLSLRLRMMKWNIPRRTRTNWRHGFTALSISTLELHWCKLSTALPIRDGPRITMKRWTRTVTILVVNDGWWTTTERITFRPHLLHLLGIRRAYSSIDGPPSRRGRNIPTLHPSVPIP